MLAILLLLLCVCAGYVVIQFCFCRLFWFDYLASPNGKIPFPLWFVVVPASFCVGIIVVGWVMYVGAYIFRNADDPMFFGCIGGLAVSAAIIALYALTKPRFITLKNLINDFIVTFRYNIWLYIFFAPVCALIIWLMIYTFFIKGGVYHMGYTVFSDFSVHTALIRSFSLGQNFPTQFPHFPDGTIRYHFMYQFFIGCLEYLGIDMVIGFNAVSILLLIGTLMLLYVLAVIITNRRAVGMLTVLFFLFRSSFSGIRYLIEPLPTTFMELINRIIKPDAFLDYTPNEGWGLWNLNVYTNQRHLALGINIALIGVLIMLPLFYAPRCRLFFSREAWLPESWRRAVGLGLLAGGLAYFHGSALIALMAMLAVLGLFSLHKLEYAITAAIAYVLARVETNFFAAGVELARPSFQWGFIAEDKSLQGVWAYILALTGITLICCVFGLLMNLKKFAVYFVMFAMPFIITFTVSLTTDITVNHKFLMISIAMLNIFAAYCVVELIKPSDTSKRDTLSVITGLFIIFFITITGVVDTFTIGSLNGEMKSAVITQNSDLQTWIKDNTEPDDLFFSYWHGAHDVFFAGRMEFFGWPYYAWSGGYDTYGREKIFNDIINEDDPDTLLKMLKENNISYILIDSDFLTTSNFTAANVQLMRDTFSIVYEDEARNIAILKTKDITAGGNISTTP
ncbi:MAG: hypothetical protein LBL96_08560 [Clostridiales bacterium]|jgi:hypothetical protein|nr:hypothetical protein [Clostridiales bacterium]